MKIGIIGIGNIASIIIDALLSGIAEPADISAFDADTDKFVRYAASGVTFAKDNINLVDSSDLIYLCVKPQIMQAVLEEIKPVAKGKLFVSVAAGISSSYIKNLLDCECSVIRVMPNTPMLMSCGAVALAENDIVNKEDFNFVKSVFDRVGMTVTLDERHIDAVTAISGSGPAYYYKLAAAAQAFGIKQGLDEKTSLMLAAKTMEGAARMLMQSDKTPEELISQVASPNGTTVAALESLDNDNFSDIFIKALECCMNRAKQLSK